MFLNGYPYTDFHEMNLDFILKAVKTLEQAFKDFTASNSLIFAEPLLHDLTKSYAKNTIVLDPDGNAYISLQTVPSGVQLSDSKYWLMVFNFEDYTEKANKNFTVNYFRDTTRSDRALAVDDWLVLDDVLYKVTTAIAVDELFEIGTNIVHFTVEQFLKDFTTSIIQTVNQYKADIDASELAYRQQLAQDIANTTASLQAQLDAAIAGATVDSEVINARVGANGVTYPTLGDAIRSQVEDVWDELENNVVEILQHNSTASNGYDHGLYYTFSGNTCTVAGTSSGTSSKNIISSVNSLPYGWKAGETYYVKYTTDDPYVRLAFFFYDSVPSQIGSGQYVSSDRTITVPSNAVGMVARLNVNTGITTNASVKFATYTSKTANELSALCEKAVKGEVLTLVGQSITSLNDAPENSVYLVDNDTPYTEKPSDMGAGFLMTIKVLNFKLQLAWALSGGKMWKRRYSITAGTWENWYNITGINNTYNNYYSYPSYSNTYNITSSPAITTDSHAFLSPSGDNTDRTSDILLMLSTYGVCNLGNGDYYVNNLEMPDGTMINGSGYASRIILAGSSDGYAVKMSDQTIVKNVRIVGSTSSIVPSSTVGGRHGILWQGTFSDDETSANQPKRSIIDNVYIANFTGGGITCYNTGYGTYNMLEVTNAYINNCGAGINVSYWSEYHRFTNVKAQTCYYGCINNGGNNMFVNCDFSSCRLAFLMDNSANQSPNESHGSCVGCSFNHTDQNTGVGIKVLNCTNGFIFDACQIFYSQIELEDAEGVVFSNCNFGVSNCDITITRGGALLFANNMHQGSPTITVSSNTNVHFDNCYVRSTGASVTP